MKRGLLAVLVLCIFLPGCGKSGPTADEIREAAYQDGYTEGHYDGYNEGYDAGWNDGIEEAKALAPEPTQKPFELSAIAWQDTPLSTAFSRIGYAEEYSVLGVVFRDSDPRIYLYYDFPQSEWENFSTAESWGGYYNENIKGRYTSERID
jgi:hypothetical protein